MDKLKFSGHILALDGIRGVAIASVMALHFLYIPTTNNLFEATIVKIASYGGLGVTLFFVLSGFLITGILLDSKNTPHFFRNFYARRTLRIFPLYFSVLGVLFFLLPLVTTLPAGITFARENQLWLWTYTSNFFIARTGTWSLGPLSHFWTLAIEEHFYIFWPFVVYFVSSRALQRVCIIIVVLSLVLRLILVSLGEPQIAIGVLTPCRIDSMCAGAWLATRLRATDSPVLLLKRIRFSAYWFVGITLAISGASKLLPQCADYIHQTRLTFIALIFTSMIAMALPGAGGPAIGRKLMENGFLRFLGKYSYGLYVYHAILSDLYKNRLIDYCTKIIGHPTAGLLAGAVAGISVSLAISWVSYELFEKKFLHLKRYFETDKASS